MGTDASRSPLQLSARETAICQLLLACFAQTCARGEDATGITYDHGFLSAYEEAQEFLLAAGMIDPDACESSSGVDLTRLLQTIGWHGPPLDII